MSDVRIGAEATRAWQNSLVRGDGEHPKIQEGNETIDRKVSVSCAMAFCDSHAMARMSKRSINGFGSAGVTYKTSEKEGGGERERTEL